METSLPTSPLDCKGSVLIVDDEENNRHLLRNLLEVQGHRVSEAIDGKDALEKVAENYPDVVVLDVMMPQMDGFEVCRRLKSEKKTAPIPVLLVTGLKDRTDRLKGMEAGANDFLSKPIDTQDMVLRVRNAIYTKRLFDQLEDSYNRLRKLEALRRNLTDMIIHDLQSPLGGMKMSLQLLQMKINAKLAEDEAYNLEWAVNLIDYLTTMIHSLLDISRLDAGEMPLKLSRGDLGKIAQEAIETLAFSGEKERVVFSEPAAPVWASIDPEVICRVIINLVENALKFSPKGRKVKVKVERSEKQARVAVMDKGPGISAEYQGRIFDKFSQGETDLGGQKYSTGLGLTFCKLAVEAHGGKIIINSEMGQGSTVQFWLPAIQETVSPIVLGARAARKKRG